MTTAGLEMRLPRLRAPWWIRRFQQQRATHEAHADSVTERESAELLGKLRLLTDNLEREVQQREEEQRGRPQRRATDPGRQHP